MGIKGRAKLLGSDFKDHDHRVINPHDEIDDPLEFHLLSIHRPINTLLIHILKPVKLCGRGIFAEHKYLSLTIVLFPLNISALNDSGKL